MTPLLFMGQEWAASTPFQFFTDHDKELGPLVSAGRREEFKAFSAFADPERRHRIPDPQAEATFEDSRLRWEERGEGEHARVLSLYRALLALRRGDPVLRAVGREGLDASARGDVLDVRMRHGGEERRVLVNFSQAGAAPPEIGGGWRVLLRSDGARGEVVDDIPPETALVLAPVKK